MVTVVVHEMISITAKLITNLFDNSSNLFLVEICTANLNTLSVVGVCGAICQVKRN